MVLLTFGLPAFLKKYSIQHQQIIIRVESRRYIVERPNANAVCNMLVILISIILNLEARRESVLRPS